MTFFVNKYVLHDKYLNTYCINKENQTKTGISIWSAALKNNQKQKGKRAGANIFVTRSEAILILLIKNIYV